MDAESFLTNARVARLATVDHHGQPFLVPICFVFANGNLYSALDEKPKRREVSELQRVTNIRSNPSVAVLVDEYDENWSKLRYVLARGLASLILPGSDEHREAIQQLRLKYPQYARMAIEANPVIRIQVTSTKVWQSASE